MSFWKTSFTWPPLLSVSENPEPQRTQRNPAENAEIEKSRKVETVDRASRLYRNLPMAA